jgi:hypothetical protein
MISWSRKSVLTWTLFTKYSQIKDYLLKELKGKFSKIQRQHHTTLSVDNKSKIGSIFMKIRTNTAQKIETLSSKIS